MARGQAFQRRPNLASSQFSQQSAADRGKDGLEDVPILLYGLGLPAAHALSKPVLDSLVQRVTARRSDPFGHLGAEPV